MSDIGRQLERLKSPNRNTRYDACEELRIAESLPPEAFTALELAEKDGDAIVADAARRALLTHRPPPSRGQADVEMANQQERCPNCGRSFVTADRRYGNELKRNAFLGRVARSFLVWIGVFVLAFLQFSATAQRDLVAFAVLVLLGLALTLIRDYRQVYGASSAGRYSDARFTCRACGHEWISAESRTTVADETDERQALADRGQQETAEEEQPPGSQAGATPGLPRSGGNRPSRWESPGRRPAVAAITTLVAAITPLVLPTLLLMGSGGEICPGYQVDVSMYYAKLAPLSLLAGLLGLVAALAWTGDSGKSETGSSRARWGIAAIAVGGVGCALTSCVFATFPGC
jgi:predicted RNA-binding Zn-ribbon protein involved in translation (DUF1610 family)